MESWPIPQPIRAWKLLGTRWFPRCHELRIETASSFWHRGVCPYRNCENSRDRGGLQPLSPQTHTAQGPQVSCGRRGAGAYLEIIYHALKPIFYVTHHHCIPVYFYKHTRTRIYIYIYSTSYSYQSLEQTTPVASKPANHNKSTHTQTDTHTELKWETLCRYNIQTPNAKNIITYGANHGKKQTPKGQPSII